MRYSFSVINRHNAKVFYEEQDDWYENNDARTAANSWWQNETRTNPDFRNGTDYYVSIDHVTAE